MALAMASHHIVKSAILGKSFSSSSRLIWMACASMSKIYPSSLGLNFKNSAIILASIFLFSFVTLSSSIIKLRSNASGSVRLILMPLNPRQRLYSYTISSSSLYSLRLVWPIPVTALQASSDSHLGGRFYIVIVCDMIMRHLLYEFCFITMNCKQRRFSWINKHLD
jgi:hypothetical protein